MSERVFVKAIIKMVAMLAAVVPPLVCTITYFPLWRERGGVTMLCGISLILILICAVPLFKLLRRVLASPSATTVWLIVFIAFFMLSKIADEVTVVSFVGFLGNAVGAVLFKIADAIDGKARR